MLAGDDRLTRVEGGRDRHRDDGGDAPRSTGLERGAPLDQPRGDDRRAGPRAAADPRRRRGRSRAGAGVEQPRLRGRRGRGARPRARQRGAVRERAGRRRARARRGRAATGVKATAASRGEAGQVSLAARGRRRAARRRAAGRGRPAPAHRRARARVRRGRGAAATSRSTTGCGSTDRTGSTRSATSTGGRCSPTWASTRRGSAPTSSSARTSTATAERLGSPRVVFTEPQLARRRADARRRERAWDRRPRGRRRDLGQRRRQLRRPQRPGNLADRRRHRPRGDRRRHLRRPGDRRVAARGDDRGHRRGADLDASSTRCRRSRPAASSGSSCSRPMAPERSGRGAVAASLLCGLLAVSALAYDGGPATRASAAPSATSAALRARALAGGLDPRLPHPPVDASGTRPRRRIGRSLASLRPTWVSGLLRYRRNQYPNRRETRTWREIRRIVDARGQAAQFDVVLNAMQYRTPAAVAETMRRMRGEARQRRLVLRLLLDRLPQAPEDDPRGDLLGPRPWGVDRGQRLRARAARPAGPGARRLHLGPGQRLPPQPARGQAPGGAQLRHLPPPQRSRTSSAAAAVGSSRGSRSQQRRRFVNRRAAQADDRGFYMSYPGAVPGLRAGTAPRSREHPLLLQRRSATRRSCGRSGGCSTVTTRAGCPVPGAPLRGSGGA